MPSPGKNEKQKDFVSRCIPIVLKDKAAKDSKQAVAICNSIWRKSKGIKDVPPKDSKMIEQTVFAEWTRAFINDLPDNSFAFIEAGGEKDKEGKTVPRSLRHLPYKDGSGKVDLPHLRNAIARASQVKGISSDKAKAIQARLQKILKSKGDTKMAHEDQKNGNKNDVKNGNGKKGEDPKKKKAVVKAVDGKCPEGYTKKGGLCFLNKASNDKKDKNDKNDKKDKKNGNNDKKSKMEGEVDSTKKEKSLFSDDEQASKLKEIIEKLEKSETLESAKLLVVEFKALLPTEATVEDSGEDSSESKEETTVEGEEKKEESKEETTEEVRGAPKAEEKKEDTAESQLAEALDLNHKMITKLQEASSQIDILENINTKLKKDNETVKKELSTYQEEEDKKVKEKAQSKFNDVFNKYCDFMSIPTEEKEQVRKQMSTFSEDMLDNTLKYVEKKEQSIMESEPQIETQPSSDLSDKEQSVMTQETYGKMSARDKTDYLFGLVKKIQR